MKEKLMERISGALDKILLSDAENISSEPDFKAQATYITRLPIIGGTRLIKKINIDITYSVDEYPLDEVEE